LTIELTLNDALEFLDTISLNGSLLRDVARESLIFRGQSSARFNLVPRALRHPKATWREQALFECDQLITFLRTADMQGLSIQDDSPDMRYFLFEFQDRLKSVDSMKINPDWPWYTLWSLAGLAQPVDSQRVYLIGQEAR